MTTKGGELLKYLASIKEKYNMEQEDTDKIITLVSDIVIEIIEGKNGNNKN